MEVWQQSLVAGIKQRTVDVLCFVYCIIFPGFSIPISNLGASRVPFIQHGVLQGCCFSARSRQYADQRYSVGHLFLVEKATGGWRIFINCYPLIVSVSQMKLRIMMALSVLSSNRKGDFMYSIDLKEACCKMPVHPESRVFHRFSL